MLPQEIFLRESLYKGFAAGFILTWNSALMFSLFQWHFGDLDLKKTDLVALVPKLEAAQWIDYLVLKIKTFVFFFTVKL